MAGIYLGAGGAARAVNALYLGAGGTACRVKEGYVGIDGVARRFFVAGTLLGALPAGALVKLKEGGVLREYIVGRQGYPAAGQTVLVRKLLNASMRFNPTNGTNVYAGSTVDTYLTGTFWNSLDAQVQQAAVAADILVGAGNGSSEVITLARKVFIPSGSEINYAIALAEGSQLPIFTDNASRVAYDETAVARSWHTRSPNKTADLMTYAVNQTGQANLGNRISAGASRYVRPALCLDAGTVISPVPDETGAYTLR